MSSSQHHNTHNKQTQLPKFEPLPPTNAWNRFINRLLAPIFYLLFTIVTSVIVVPIYVIIDNFKHGRGKSGGERFAKDESEQYPGQPEKKNKAASFLKEYGRSYSGAQKHERHEKSK